MATAETYCGSRYVVMQSLAEVSVPDTLWQAYGDARGTAEIKKCDGLEYFFIIILGTL